MSRAASLVAEIRRELAVEPEIRGNPYLEALEVGRIPREDLRFFAGEQFHIIRSDLRSVALLAHRFGASPSGEFFRGVLGGEAAALQALHVFARALGMDEAALEGYEPSPGGQAYPAYMAWLALYGSDAAVAAGYLVNFSAWGENCGRMSRALRGHYGFQPADVAFFDLFASPPPDFEAQALAVIEAGLGQGTDARLITRAARLLQAYEKLYWDAVHGMSRR
jgi:hypothetical protein